MKTKFIPVLIGAVLVLIAAAVVFFQINAAPKPSPQSNLSTDPQKLLIPRWFLRSLTLNGQAVELPADQQALTLQFADGNTVSGSGGCNSFGGSYQAGADGKLSFGGPLISSQMACLQGMQLESAYFNALAKVQQFQLDGGRLTLASADGQTSLVFAMPPR
jgi:heat shock protein HslJ